MKKVFYLLMLLPLCACNNGQGNGNGSADSGKASETQENATASSENSELTDSPEISIYGFPVGIVPMYCLGDGTSIFLYDTPEDSVKYVPMIPYFKTLYFYNKPYTIESIGPQAGTVGYGCLEFNDQYFGKLNGVRYKFTAPGNFGGACFAVTDKFLNSNNLVTIVDAPYDESNSMPADMVKMLEAKYGQKITASHKSASIDDGKAAFYVAQFEPQETTCLAVRVLVDGGKTYIYEDPGEVYPGEGPSWHVDDDGEYAVPGIEIAVRTDSGLKLFYTENAPESTSYGVMCTDGDALMSEMLVQYYNYVDYSEE